MVTGSELPRLTSSSGQADDQAATSPTRLPESTTHRESPTIRLQSPGREPRTGPRCESNDTGRASTDQACWGWNRGDRRFVAVVSAIALMLMAAHWLQITQWSPAPVEVDRPAGEIYRFVLDANRATWVEWMQLEGIGETLARRIVEDRALNGPFPDVDALDRVPGIGPKTLERMRTRVIVSEQKIVADITD